MSKNSVRAIEMQSLDASTLVGVALAPINPLGLEEACFLLRITNISKNQVNISYDGITMHDTIPAGGTIIVATLIEATNYAANISKGTVVYVSDTFGAANVGYVYLTGYYHNIS